MGLRKATCYSKRPTVPFTRKSKVKQKNYIKSVPGVKVTKMRMGDIVGFKKQKYPIILEVKAGHNVQMRDNALEAARQYLNRFLTEKIGKEFYLEVKPYPHHVLRENKMLTGAGADRMQTGMALSFGKSMGRASLIKFCQTIFVIGIMNTKHEAIARDLVRAVKARLPCTVYIDTTRFKK